MREISLKKEKLNVAIIIVVTFAVFANTLAGEFVYDDTRQILRNPLIQDSRLYGKAMVSDVWAFKGDGTIAASNYWRPTFTAFSILEFKAFGTNPFGWHLSNVLLHILACLAAFYLLLLWRVPRYVALALTLIFAVHPVHSESVAWIAGSPDLLFGLFMILSLILAEKMRAAPTSTKYLFSAIVCYLLALGSKETAFFCLPLFYLILYRPADQDLESEAVDTAAMKRTTPMVAFASAAAGYFLVRLLILGAISRPMDDAAGTGSAIMSVGKVFTFYLRQILLPITLGESYPLRPSETVDLTSVILPFIGFGAVMAACVYLSRKDRISAAAFAIFILPIVPVLYVGIFPADQIVHDRYLYFSLLGFLVLAYKAVELYVPTMIVKFQKPAAAVAMLVVVILGARSIVYNAVWADNLTLWAYNTKIDPNSAIAFNNYGSELYDQKKYREALAAYDHSVAIRSTPLALMGRARSNMAVGDLPKAIDDLTRVIAMPAEDVNAYTLYQTYESYAIAQQMASNLPEAAEALRKARVRLPIYRAALTEKLSVVLYLQGKNQEALMELEGVRPYVDRELSVDAKVVYLRLGMLYAESGKPTEAKRDLNSFLSWTSNVTDPEMLAYRDQAAATLKNLR